MRACAPRSPASIGASSRWANFGARIHGFGELYLSLVAYSAEEGMESEINVLFDPAVKRVFAAEDAAAFASRICLEGLCAGKTA